MAVAALPKFFHGDPATKALNAGFLNAIVSRLNDVRPSRIRTRSDRDGPSPTVDCYVVNNTSGPFDIHNVVAAQSVGMTISTGQDKIDFQNKPFFSIDVPAASTDFPMICLEPIPAHGGVGRVAIGGIAVCTVNVTDAAHKYANPTPGDETRMTSAATGQVRILWKDSGTGNKTAVVYLVEPSGSGGTCVDIDTTDTLSITIPGRVLSWSGSINPTTCVLTLTPTYDDDTVQTFEVSLTGNTCTDLTLTVTEL